MTAGQSRTDRLTKADLRAEIVRLRAESIPAELFVLVVEALNTVEGELHMLDGQEIPLPQKVVEQLRERAALLGALRSAPETWKPALRAWYETGLAAGVKGSFEADGVEIPILPEVKAMVADVFEQLRRSALTVPAVDAALRQVVPL